ncbi:hypothetical protein R70331_22015 [Paenibacillus sp. FSL R7-0331]|nr:hypothetical protein R70331_22015 [Paenibacillus sp. FSL R7-0331]
MKSPPECIYLFKYLKYIFMPPAAAGPNGCVNRTFMICEKASGLHGFPGSGPVCAMRTFAAVIRTFGLAGSRTVLDCCRMQKNTAGQHLLSGGISYSMLHRLTPAQ